MVHPQEKERSGEGEARREILHEIVKFRQRAVSCRQLQTLSTRRIGGLSEFLERLLSCGKLNMWVYRATSECVRGQAQADQGEGLKCRTVVCAWSSDWAYLKRLL